MAPKAGVIQDANKNAQRQREKNIHQNFKRALAKLPEDHEARCVLASLPRKNVADFYKAWAKDPTWRFVQVYKTSSQALVDNTHVATTYKSKAWLIREMGKTGALNHIQAMTAAGKVKEHATSKQLLYEYRDEVQNAIVENRRDKKVTCQASSSLPSEGVADAMQALLAIEDKKVTAATASSLQEATLKKLKGKPDPNTDPSEPAAASTLEDSTNGLMQDEPTSEKHANEESANEEPSMEEPNVEEPTIDKLSVKKLKKAVGKDIIKNIRKLEKPTLKQLYKYIQSLMGGEAD